MRSSPLRVAVLIAANLLGLLAFLWPFVLPLGGPAAHQADAPVILVGLLVLLGAVLFVELGRGGLGPKAVALIGVLGAAMVARGRAPSALDLPADSSMPVTLVQT